MAEINSKKNDKKIKSNVKRNGAYFEVHIDGTIIEIGDYIESISQYKKEELIGRSMWNLYSNPSDREKLLEEIVKKGYISGYEIKLLNRDGSVVLGYIDGKLHYNDSNTPIKLSGTLYRVDKKEPGIE